MELSALSSVSALTPAGGFDLTAADWFSLAARSLKRPESYP